MSAAATALFYSAAGGFFGMMLALWVFYLFARNAVKSGMQQWLKKSHEAGVCPLCHQPVKHDQIPTA